MIVPVVCDNHAGHEKATRSLLTLAQLHREGPWLWPPPGGVVKPSSSPGRRPRPLGDLLPLAGQ